MDSPTFTNKSDEFLRWFMALPGATFHPHIRLEDLRERGAGRGIVAVADIEPETTLFTIPRASIICAATSELAKKIPGLLDLGHGATLVADGGDGVGEDEEMSIEGGGGKPADASQDSWTSLILIMIFEHLRGDASPWKPYLGVLPADFDTLMHWSDDELVPLAATSVLSKIGKAEAAGMIRDRIVAVVRRHEHVFFPAEVSNMTDGELTELAFRMGSTIMAYAFDLEKDDEDDDDGEGDGWVEDKEGRTMMGMVPMADMLNADAECNAHINHGEDALRATALRPIRAGEEILNYYGPLPNGELLRRYGYTTERHARFDIAELPWKLVLDSLAGILGLSAGELDKVISSLDPDEIEDGFVIDRGQDEPDSTGRLPLPHPLTRAQHAGGGGEGEGEDPDVPVTRMLPDELAEQVRVFLKAVRKMKPAVAAATAVPDTKTARKRVSLEAVCGALRGRLAQFPPAIPATTTATSGLGRGQKEEEKAGEEQLLAEARRGAQGGGGAEQRRCRRLAMALEVRMGEKAVLREVIAAIEAALAALVPEEGEDNGVRQPAAKRQKRSR